jgi:hypothetical protein
MTDRRFVLFGALIICMGTALRIAALFNDFWIDEILSWEFAQQIDSPLAIITNVHSDNNHHLNTLFLYLLRKKEYWTAFTGYPWIIYRLPSLLFGVGSIILAGFIAKPRGAGVALCTMLLMSLSFPMILYSSEARGFMSAVFFTLLALLVYERGIDEKPDVRQWSWLRRSTLWGSIILGFLSHLTAVSVFIALAVRVFLRCKRRKEPAEEPLFRLLCIPLLTFVLLVLIDTTHLDYYGRFADASIVADILATLSLPLGMSASWATALGSIALVAMTLMSTRKALQGEEPERWAFHALIMILTLGVMFLFALHPGMWFARYALVPFAILLIFASEVLGKWSTQGRIQMKFAFCLLLLFAITNIGSTVQLLRYGRGQYRAPLVAIAKQTQEETVLIDSNHSLGTVPTIRFYARYLPKGKAVVHRKQNRKILSPATWYIVVHSAKNTDASKPSLRHNDAEYGLAGEYRTSVESGFRWLVYHRTQ